ncbi:RluA family pseudouridine synthase [Alphaproteobacteria bacterium]|nr:RluA family pseudouridine synthase [Alphaproteobacteria bacterium]
MKSYNYKTFQIQILYEDDQLAILNKPAALLTHKKNYNDQEPSLCESLKINFDISDEEPLKEGIVHRLDKLTSGIIIIAKNNSIKEKLKKLFKNRYIDKFYTTYVIGNFLDKEKNISGNISRQNKQRTKFQMSDEQGKDSLTIVKHKETFFGSISLLECKIITGRTHQIRVHLSNLGFPLIGDRDYQKNLEQKFMLKNLPNNIKVIIDNFSRQALHSSRINFIHPVTNELINIECPLPDDLKYLDKVLRNDR